MACETKTRIDLVNQALQELGIIAAGQTASAEDYDAMDSHVDAFIAGLQADQICTVIDIDEIPLEWFLPMALLLADVAASQWGLPGIPGSPGNPTPADDAEATLRTRNRGLPTGEPMRTEYF